MSPQEAGAQLADTVEQFLDRKAQRDNLEDAVRDYREAE